MTNVPEYIKPTGEWIKKETLRQARLRDEHGIGRDHRKENRGEVWFQYHRNQATLSIANLERLTEEDADPAAIIAEQNRLAVCLCYTGEFELALSLTSDDLVRGRIERIRHAVERDDSEICACPNTIHTDSRGTTTIDPRNSRTGEYVFSPKHGQVMAVRVCARCGDMQVGGNVAKRTDDSKHRDPRMTGRLATAKRRR